MLSQFLLVTGVRAQTIIAASGDAAPAGGNYTTFLNSTVWAKVHQPRWSAHR